MGNHNSQANGTGSGQQRKSISRTSSGADIKEQHASLIPIDKLAKILGQKTAEEETGQSVISSNVFIKYLFPQYPVLGARVFSHMVRSAGSTKTKTITTSHFRQQADKLLAVIIDEGIADLYVKIFSEGSDEVKRDQVMDLLMLTYRLAMDNYPDGPQTCLDIHTTLQAVVDSAVSIKSLLATSSHAGPRFHLERDAFSFLSELIPTRQCQLFDCVLFHKKSAVSVGYITNWLLHHLPRLVPLLHRFVVHVLTTAYRSLQERQPVSSSLPGMELTTPVLEKTFDLSCKSPPPLLPVSQVWLLATSLPSIYTLPSDHPHGSPSHIQTNSTSAQSLIAKMLGSTYPSHWTLLYNTNQHGMGANRFLHHVLNYRGPTLTFLRGQEGVEFCLAADSEWHESNHYWGQQNCCILQILPLFHVIERGAKIMYLNMSIRGYPKGIQAGKEPSSPSITVDESFNMVTYSRIPYPLVSVEVWGCGTVQSKEQQQDHKKWEMKQTEKQRVVKLTAADWADHPDRYLLELGGRQSYNPPPS